MNESWGRLLVRSWAFLVLGLLAVVFAVMLSFSRKAPVISSLEPDMAAPGQQVVIEGDYFGRTEREGTLSLAGEIPPPSLIQSWTDQKIVFVVPEDASSGLVTVSNSQGTSTGVLFTNTKSIPTVLKAASVPGTPLVTGAAPSQPSAGQRVTLSGRGFGEGDQPSTVRVSAGKAGPVFVFSPAESLGWSDREISFRWPTGAGESSTVQVVTPAGETTGFPMAGSTPQIWEDPKTLTVEISLSATVEAGGPLVLWGPLPQNTSGTSWDLVSAQPVPMEGIRPLVFRWPAGGAGVRTAVYQLTVTSWNRRWTGLPAGPVGNGDAPATDPRPAAWWKPAQASIKALTAKWGLDTSDPWLRVQRIQTGLSNAFRFLPPADTPLGLTRSPAEALGSGALDPAEASSLAAYLAAQAGIPVRLVTGLWLGDRLVSRVWAEVWFAGAGWIPWDAAEGGPGNLDNRHFAWETEARAPVRLVPRARVFGPAAGFTQGGAAGESVRGESEPIVQWTVNVLEK